MTVGTMESSVWTLTEAQRAMLYEADFFSNYPGGIIRVRPSSAERVRQGWSDWFAHASEIVA